MSITVITPSYRSSKWLRLCVASVADQEGVKLEHIVQDSCSDDGTFDWLRQDRRVKLFVEKDQGMYDAVNRGLRRAGGDILAYLNCDEQYLPGALQNVKRFFQEHPDIQVVFGDVVLVDGAGNYLCHRKMQTPLKYHTWTCHLSTLTCATFFRRNLIDSNQSFFDPGYRSGGDGEWMLRLLKQRVRMASLRQFTSLFTSTGANLGQSAAAREEWKRLRNTAPWWARALAPLWVAHHRFRRFLDGSYRQPPFAYSLYTLESPDRRVIREVARPVVGWRSLKSKVQSPKS